jgi:hypothetical protein
MTRDLKSKSFGGGSVTAVVHQLTIAARIAAEVRLPAGTPIEMAVPHVPRSHRPGYQAARRRLVLPAAMVGATLREIE